MIRSVCLPVPEVHPSRYGEPLFRRTVETAGGIDEAQFVLLVAVFVEAERPAVSREVTKATEVDGGAAQALKHLFRRFSAEGAHRTIRLSESIDVAELAVKSDVEARE